MPPRRNSDAPEIAPTAACTCPHVRLSAAARVNRGFASMRDFRSAFIAPRVTIAYVILSVAKHPREWPQVRDGSFRALPEGDRSAATMYTALTLSPAPPGNDRCPSPRD